MGRTDAWALDVPGAPPVIPAEIEPVVATPVTTPVSQILDQVASAAERKQAERATCPSCNARLSGVEQKFERCLSCGKTFSSASGSMNVGI